ncbi:hypothetical protein K2X89_14185 [Myxococcota bacterium]|nr:hypothetical protein [Myxococcota bacterium]
MAFTRKILRTWSALWLALVVYAATPHVHSESEQSAAPAVIGGRACHDDAPFSATSGLRSDDAHESHSSSASLDTHPCTLCRGDTVRPFGSATPTPLLPLADTTLRIDLVVVTSRAELLLARHHPARAPPLV